jgi:nitroreductase
MMRKFTLPVAQLALTLLLICPSFSSAQELKAIQLSPPQMDGGKPLMQALKERASGRTFSPEKLPIRVLSNMLWAAFGVNRPDSGGRTAPTASNSQEMDIYVAMADGLYLYDAKANLLKPVLADDIRALTGRQAFVKEAPVDLIYVSDLSKMTRAAPGDRDFYAAAHTGFISQNVYLFCASEGLATVVRASIDRPALAKAMGLRPDQKITLSQTVAHPKK